MQPQSHYIISKFENQPKQNLNVKFHYTVLFTVEVIISKSDFQEFEQVCMRILPQGHWSDTSESRNMPLQPTCTMYKFSVLIIVSLY